MRITLLLLACLLIACGGRLSDEQRKKLKEGMELSTIKKVNDAELTEAAFALGRSFAEHIEQVPIRDRKKIDSLQSAYHIRIHPLQPGDAMLLELERQIVEAYTSGIEPVDLHDNIQRLGTDSLLYTKPVLKKNADGSTEFDYALGIRISKKQVVLSIKD